MLVVDVHVWLAGRRSNGLVRARGRGLLCEWELVGFGGEGSAGHASFPSDTFANPSRTLEWAPPLTETGRRVANRGGFGAEELGVVSGCTGRGSKAGLDIVTGVGSKGLPRGWDKAGLDVVTGVGSKGLPRGQDKSCGGTKMGARDLTKNSLMSCSRRHGGPTCHTGSIVRRKYFLCLSGRANCGHDPRYAHAPVGDL